MSLLPPEIHAALATLLQNLSSADNATRTHAEERLNNEWFNKRPDVLLVGLVEQIQQSQDTSVRVSCNLLGMQLYTTNTVILVRQGLLPQSCSAECQPKQGVQLEKIQSRRSNSCCYSHHRKSP